MKRTLALRDILTLPPVDRKRNFCRDMAREMAGFDRAGFCVLNCKADSNALFSVEE